MWSSKNRSDFLSVLSSSNSGVLQCGNVGENFSVHLSCAQNGGVISQVDFASYGTSVGGCGQMKQGACHATNSSEVVQRVCIGQQECSVPATSDLFGDPCKLTVDVTERSVKLFDFFEKNVTQNSKFLQSA